MPSEETWLRLETWKEIDLSYTGYLWKNHNKISQKSLEFMKKSNPVYCMSQTFGQGYSNCLKYIVLSVELLVFLFHVF